MKLLDLTLDTAQENVALDEAVLESAEAAGSHQEVLRLWEPRNPLVVIGRSSKFAEETDVDYCSRNRIPIIRRCSGGAAIVTGPGCLMYAVLIDLQVRPELVMLDKAHHYVMSKMAAAIRRLGHQVEICGTSDLAIGGRKISGNSLRLKRKFFVYHGTLLYDFPGELIQSCLRTPPRQPEYRKDREHREFVTSIGGTATALRESLIRVWQANQPLEEWPAELTSKLVSERYSRDEWNRRR